MLERLSKYSRTLNIFIFIKIIQGSFSITCRPRIGTLFLYLQKVNILAFAGHGLYCNCATSAKAVTHSTYMTEHGCSNKTLFTKQTEGGFWPMRHSLSTPNVDNQQADPFFYYYYFFSFSSTTVEGVHSLAETMHAGVSINNLVNRKP